MLVGAGRDHRDRDGSVRGPKPVSDISLFNETHAALLSSQAFFDSIADQYLAFLDGRKRYLQGIEQLIIEAVSQASTVIDLGSGNGERARRIAAAIGARRLMLVDNSASMLALSRRGGWGEHVLLDAADPAIRRLGRFDLVMCLWNVLGHVSDVDGRLKVLEHLCDLVADEGCLFIDVNNRYNARAYGWHRVLRNIISDVACSQEGCGDFDLELRTPSGRYWTRVHLFSPQELESLFGVIGLRIVRRFPVDYATGKVVRSAMNGQLLYQLCV